MNETQVKYNGILSSGNTSKYSKSNFNAWCFELFCI